MEMSYYLNVFVQHGRIVIHIPWMGCSGFLNFWPKNLRTFQGLFKDFQGHISLFSTTLFSEKESLESMSFLVLLQHDQFYPEGLSVFAPFPLDRIKLALKFKDIPPPTVIFKDFQGLEFLFKIQGLSKCMQTLHISPRG